MPRIAIIGIGLIGGSLALALKRAQIESLEIVGCDTERGVAGRARKQGAIDHEARDATSAARGAAIVAVATPISQLRDVFEAIAPALEEGAIVTDTASTKRDPLRWAAELLPEHVSFVGGHPMAGKEQPGLDAADAALFEGRPWAITPSMGASEGAIRAVEGLVATVGARPVIIDGAEHDSYVAAVSHLPLVASTALFTLASQSQAWPDLATLAGPGFRDLTRLASTDPGLSHDICLTNRENLLHWLDRYIEELRRLRGLIADEGRQEELYKEFVRAQADRDVFLTKPPERGPAGERPETPSAREQMLSFMMGDYLVRRTKEIDRMLDERERDLREQKGP
jgi:prephenate dehydrogenase